MRAHDEVSEKVSHAVFSKSVFVKSAEYSLLEQGRYDFSGAISSFGRRTSMKSRSDALFMIISDFRARLGSTYSPRTLLGRGSRACRAGFFHPLRHCVLRELRGGSYAGAGD
jgi:hypothetical protein